MKTMTCTLMILLAFNGIVLGDRILDKTEIEQIFKILTDQPQKTWINSGTIYANHEEYKSPQTTIEKDINEKIDKEVQAYINNPQKIELTEKSQKMKLDAIPFNIRYQLSNEYTMKSRVILKYDGDRFYWEIIVDSREDSVKPSQELLENYYAEEFNLSWNQHRLFAWDGSKYIKYYQSGNQAIINEKPGNVNGPLTAGIIFWGYDKYSYQNLMKANSSAIEVESNNQKEVHLFITNDERNEIYVLDPLKNYSVKYYSLKMQNGLLKECRYSNYRFILNRWLPNNIVIELYNENMTPHKLVSQDIWNFTSIDAKALVSEDFSVKFDYDTLIDDYRFGKNSFRFRYSPPEAPSSKAIDIYGLIKERLEMLHLSDQKVQNCATASLKYVCLQLGHDVSWKELSQLVNGAEKGTNMLNMQKFLNNSGLYALAVKTDLRKLECLNGYQIILYLQEYNHYVVYANIDKKYVRLIDLDQNNVYYRQSREAFNKKWNGIALIVDNRTINLDESFAKLKDNILCDINGASACQACNTKYQEAYETHCTEPYLGGCGGEHKIGYPIYKCGDSESGSCSEELAPESESALCIVDPNCNCSGNGEWVINKIPACPHE